MAELETCPVCEAPGIFHNPKRANRWTYQVCCARDPKHLDVRDERSAQVAVDEWNQTCRARRPL